MNDKALCRRAAALLAAFIFLFCANTLFIHTHVVQDGVSVVHSHPFLPNGGHTHSSQAIQVISLINSAMLVMDIPSETELHAELVPLRVLAMPPLPDPVRASQSPNAGRDPPYVLLSEI